MTVQDTKKLLSGDALAGRQVSVLLIDDQAMVGEAVRRMLAEEPGIEFTYCQDPTQALSTAAGLQPTVILQDLVMPDIDGLTLVKFFKANEATKEIPLIVLSTKEEPATKAEAFSLGASDYLVKLPDKIELIARVKHHSQGYINLLQRNQAMEMLAQELAEASDYVKKALPEPIAEGPVRVDWRFVPSTSLGGDAFGYERLDDDHIGMYLLDVSGHGVGAALLSVSVMNIMRARTLPGTDFRDPSQVLAALNEAFPMEEHNFNFFTIFYAVYNSATKTLEYASGGHPPALFVPHEPGSEGPLIELRTDNPVIGGMPGLEFSKDSYELPGPGRLYVFSDGVFEIADPDGVMWEMEEFLDFMAEPIPPDQSGMDRLYDKVKEISQVEILDDDFSIMEITFE